MSVKSRICVHQSTKCGFSKKAFRRPYFFLFTYVLLTCYHHLREKLGMYIVLCIFLNFWKVCNWHYWLSIFFLGDVVVRVTFVLGNLAARSSEARIGIGMHCDTVSLLPLLLRHYLSDMLREVTNSSDVFTNLEFQIYNKI